MRPCNTRQHPTAVPAPHRQQDRHDPSNASDERLGPFECAPVCGELTSVRGCVHAGAGASLCPFGRSPARVPGIRCGPTASAHSCAVVEHGSLLGTRIHHAHLRPAVEARERGAVRQARHWPVRPHGYRSDARGAHRRHRGGDGRSGVGAGELAGHLRRWPDGPALRGQVPGACRQVDPAQHDRLVALLRPPRCAPGAGRCADRIR